VEFCSVGNKKVPLPDLNTENEFFISTFLSWINETIRKYKFDGIRIDTFRHVRQSFWKDYIRLSGVYSLAATHNNLERQYQELHEKLKENEESGKGKS